MSPITPFWEQPSHPTIQEVIYGEDENGYTTKSISKVKIPPFGLFAKMEFPPCTTAPEASYATVQMGRDTHINLNSDLLYINHSCEPSLIFDPPSSSILAGPHGLHPNQELTFFYPSTEWAMSQSFDCTCGSEFCRGTISGAGMMEKWALESHWLSPHVRSLLAERERSEPQPQHQNNEPQPQHQNLKPHHAHNNNSSSTAHPKPSTKQPKGEEAQTTQNPHSNGPGPLFEDGESKTEIEIHMQVDGNGNGKLGGSIGNGNGNGGRGVTSREMSGEMGGDTE